MIKVAPKIIFWDFDGVIKDSVNVKTWAFMNLFDKCNNEIKERIRLHHESATGRDGYQDFYKKNVTFQVLGPVGDIVEKWTLNGTYIQDAAFGDLDFSASEPVEITLTLRYDYAILEF